MTVVNVPAPVEAWHIPHTILGELLARDIGVTLVGNGWKVEGFYKSDSVTLIPAYVEDEIVSFTAVSRYDEADNIETWDDLVRLHFRWWRFSSPRWVGWRDPHPAWANDYLRLGLATIATGEMAGWKAVET